jgi:adenylate kinase
MRLLLLGGPGAGKGTQAQYISKRFSIPQISTGDMLRAAVKSGSALGMEARKVMDSGHLVSDNIIMGLIRERIQEPDCENGYLLDGFPRTLAQAETMKKEHIDIDFVVEIEVPDEEIIKRMGGRRAHLPSGRTYHILFNPPKISDVDDITGEPLTQRVDDEEDTVRERLAVYHKQTEPLTAYYSQLASADSNAPRYVKIEGVGGVEDIRDRIFASLQG